MGRHNKAVKERKKAMAREENKLVEISATEVSATNSTSLEANSKAVEFVQASEDERPQETVRGNGTANGSYLINETGKESGRANEAMKTEGAPRGWSQFSYGDLRKFEEASSVFRDQPSKLEGLSKPRVEGLNAAENSVYSGGYSKFGEEAFSVFRLKPSRLEGLPDCCAYTSHGVICRDREPMRVSQDVAGERVIDTKPVTAKTCKYDETMGMQGHFRTFFTQIPSELQEVIGIKHQCPGKTTSNAWMPLADYSMGRHNKATKERKAKGREENNNKEIPNKDAAVKPSVPSMAAEVSATNSAFVETKFRASEDERPQESVRGNGNANGSCLINENGKESSRANGAMKTEGAPRGWSQLANGDLRKFEETSSVFRVKPSKLEGLEKPRVEGSNSVENNVYKGGYSKIEEVSSVVTLQPSKLEARQNPRVESSNPVENKVNGVGNSAQSHSGDFRTAGNGSRCLRGGYAHQASRVDKPRVEGSNPVENKVNGVGYSAQSHSGDFRTAGNGRGGIRGRGYGHQASESQVDDFTRIDSLGRLLSNILRHQAVELRLNIRSDGYVLVKDLLNLRRRTYAGLPLSSYTVDDIKEVVRMDKKQRFGLREENGQLLIRANQGHSIETIKSEDLLNLVCSVEEVPVCVHGTYLRNLDAIRKEGLKRMTRNHVHFATGLLKEKSVKSGMRSNCEVLIHLDVQKYLKDGLKLYRSENGVILAEGKDGVIPSDYFAKIQSLRS